MRHMEKLAAIIIAAGYSSRMQDFKPLLPLGKTTVLETSVDCFHRAGIRNLIVVTGYREEAIHPVLARINVSWTSNLRYAEGMFSSIAVGIKALPADVDACFLLPVDMPLVKTDTILRLAKVYYETPAASVVYPVYRERKGHPPLISARLFPEILSWQGEGGLRKLLAMHGENAQYLTVEDEGVLTDADTPEDYQKLQQMIREMG